MRTLTSYDVDTDALADVFERMADGLRSHDVLVDELTARESVTAEDMADFRFEMAYHATHGFVDVTDPIQYDATHYLRFADQYVEPVLQGDKPATMRVGFERDFDVGDVVDLIDEDDTKFGEATIAGIHEGPVRDVASSVDYYESHTVEWIVDTLREHYPDTVDADTVVTVFEFRDVTGVDE